MNESKVVSLNLADFRDKLLEIIESTPDPPPREKLPGEPPQYVVNCRGGCGQVELTTDQYLAQMRCPDALWRCPDCGEGAWFCDSIFDAWCKWAEEHHPRALQEADR
jgi:hypothetical protein